jgi:hypothetical protein
MFNVRLRYRAGFLRINTPPQTSDAPTGTRCACSAPESGRRNSGLSPSAMCATAAGQRRQRESPRRVPAPARRCGLATPQFSPMRLLSSLKNVFDSTCRTPQANVLGINQKTSLKRKLNNTTVLKAIFVRSRTRVLRGRSKFF